MKLHVAPTVLGLLALASACEVRIGNDGLSTRSLLDFRPYRLDSEASEARETALAVDGVRQVVLADFDGDLSFSARGDAAPTLKEDLAVRAADQETARSLLARTTVDVVRDGDTLRVTLSRPETREASWSASRFLLVLPPGLALTARTASGDVDLGGPFGDVALESGYGDVQVEGSRGGVQARTSSGDVSVTDVQGTRVVASSSYGAVDLGDVQAQAVEATSDSGDVHLERVRAGTTRAHSGYGGLRLRAVQGEVLASTGSGDVDAAELSGPVIELTSGYGDVRLASAGGDDGEVRLALSSGSGDVVARDVRGSVRAHSGYGAIDVRGVLSGLQADTGSGDLRVVAEAGSRIGGAWSATSSYGDVRVSIPRDLALDLAASTGYGRVHSDFDVLVEAGNQDRENRLAGSISGGGPTLTLHTGSGDVELRALNP